MSFLSKLLSISLLFISTALFSMEQPGPRYIQRSLLQFRFPPAWFMSEAHGHNFPPPQFNTFRRVYINQQEEETAIANYIFNVYIRTIEVLPPFLSTQNHNQVKAFINQIGIDKFALLPDSYQGCCVRNHMKAFLAHLKQNPVRYEEFIDKWRTLERALFEMKTEWHRSTAPRL